MPADRAPTLVDEAFDLTRWLDVEPVTAAEVIAAAVTETRSRRWDTRRELEVLLLGAIAARSMAYRSRPSMRTPPKLSPRALHPTSTVLAPAGSVDTFARTAREVLALLPADLAGVALLSMRYEVDVDEVASMLQVARRRAAALVDDARSGFVGTAGAVLLWNGGEPLCAELRELAALTGFDSLGQSAARLLVDHAERCRHCGTRLWQATEVVSALATAPLSRPPAELVSALAGPIAALDRRRPR